MSVILVNPLSECTIDVILSNGIDYATATPIVRSCPWTVLYCTPSADGQGLVLPNGQPGDLIQIYISALLSTGPWVLNVYPLNTDTIFGAGAPPGSPVLTAVGQFNCLAFFALTSSVWARHF